MQHPIYIIGKNKKDTTKFLREQVFLPHVLEGRGGAYFDFSGDVTPVLRHIPPERKPILFFPMDRDFPMGLNLLHHPPDKRATLEAIVNAFRSVWPSDIATTRIDLYLKACVLSLLAVPDATLLGITELLTNDRYRIKVMGHLKDEPLLLSFWRRYDELPDKEKMTLTESTLTRAFTFAIDPIVRNCIGQTQTSFTIKDDTILIASFPQELGVEMGNFLATLLLSQLPDAMLTVLDDGHRIGTAAVREALTRLQIVFSHQYAAQLHRPLYETLIGTAATIVAFATGPTDSKRLSPEFGIVQEGDMLHHLGPLQFRIRGDSTGYDTRHEQRLEAADFPALDIEKHRNVSRHDYAHHCEEVERRIASFFAVDDEPKKRSKSRKSR